MSVNSTDEYMRDIVYSFQNSILSFSKPLPLDACVISALDGSKVTVITNGTKYEILRTGFFKLSGEYQKNNDTDTN